MSSRILAVDTTSEHGSIALVVDGGVVEEVRLHSPDGFAHVLFGEIEGLLGRRGVALGDIDVFASASGPGAFTGVRVGLAAVKGLAEASGRRVIAVSNLQALASFGSGPLRAVILDARRGEIFGAVYNDALELVREEAVMKAGAFLASLPEGVEIVEGHGARTLAGAIGMIAWTRLNLALDPVEIDANYVRRSDAEMLWKE